MSKNGYTTTGSQNDGHTAENGDIVLNTTTVTFTKPKSSMKNYYAGEFKKAKFGSGEKINPALGYMEEVAGFGEKEIFNAMKKPLKTIGNMVPLMYIGHAIEGIKSNGGKDAFGNDMDAVSWGLMGVGAPFSIFGIPETSIFVPLGADVINDIRTNSIKKGEKKR